MCCHDSMLLFFLLIVVNGCFFFFFFNDTATTEIYTLSLHDALPISAWASERTKHLTASRARDRGPRSRPIRATSDRKSTRLNSSHLVISYAVFCLKKKKTTDYRLSASVIYATMSM